MGYGTITQLALIVVSIVIIFSYISPTFAEIQQTQDEVVEYADAVSKAAEFNALLNELVAIEQSISAADREALEKFLPTEVDHIQVMRDIENIAQLESVIVDSITTDSSVSPTDGLVLQDAEMSNIVPLDHRDFTLSLTADYEQFKRFLGRLEENEYVIEIMSMNLAEPNSSQPDPTGSTQASIDAGLHSISMTLRVYAQNS